VNRQLSPFLSRLEWLFPLRGRWLRYFMLGTGAVLLVLCWLSGCWDEFPSILSADPRYTRWELTNAWGFGCGMRMSMLGQAMKELQLGPLHVGWVHPFTQSWPERAARAAQALFLVFIGAGVIGSVLTGHRRESGGGDRSKSDGRRR